MYENLRTGGNMDLGLSLKIALAKSKKSQAQLADDLGLKRQAVNRWAVTDRRFSYIINR